MTKTKVVLAVGMILLFLGLSMSPATATLSWNSQREIIGLREALQTSMSCDNQDVILGKFLPLLTEKMQTATSVQELINILHSCMREWGRYPLVMMLLQIIIKLITWNNQFNKLRPVRYNAFIISWGFANGLLPSKENRLNIFRPFTMWYYAGRSNMLLNSRTMIFDLSPFNIKTLTGRQIGFVRDFAGIYLYRHQTLMDMSSTLMIGHGKIIRGFDLSPFSC